MPSLLSRREEPELLEDLVDLNDQSRPGGDLRGIIARLALPKHSEIDLNLGDE